MNLLLKQTGCDTKFCPNMGIPIINLKTGKLIANLCEDCQKYERERTFKKSLSVKKGNQL